MQHIQNISTQRVSWVKSNKAALEKHSDAIKNLWYPETRQELVDLLNRFHKEHISYDLIGYSSNTLFLPSYSIDNLVCTKRLDNYEVTDDAIVCDCGVNVAKLAREMVKKGYQGFFGLTDLPGTIASGVYGNCGCFDCSVCELVESFTLLTDDGEITTLHTEDLKLQYRSTSLKRHELSGTILQVKLKKIEGNPIEEQQKADKAHADRKATQPNAGNNLGTTFIGSKWTAKGKLLWKIDRVVRKVTREGDIRKRIRSDYKIIGGGRYVNYIYYWNRYMFRDENSHKLFPQYVKFLHSICSDVHMEIEIKK